MLLSASAREILFMFLLVFVPSLGGSTRLGLTLMVLLLVGRGFQQEHGPDYDETFAPGNRMTTVRTLLIVAFVRHRSMSRLDVKNAFLNGELREEVYIHPPVGILHLTTCFVIFITLWL